MSYAPSGRNGNRRRRRRRRRIRRRRRRLYSSLDVRQDIKCRDLVLNSQRVFFFLILVCEAIGTAATPGLLCQPRVIVKIIVEKQIECRLAGKTEVLGENLPQRYFCPSQNPT
jgi:hypothetical protein